MKHIGEYEVVGEIGRGGMGVVYLARQPSLDRLVAIKLLAADDRAMAERLEQEARRLADLRHPNIVTVIDVGREEGQPYYVMTYCAGGTLTSVLERDGRLTPGQVTGVLAPVAQALGAVHARGLVHRDVKPSNVLLSEGGQPYLGDLGIAIDSGADRPTTTGAVLGTIGYTAPEIIEGGRVTPAADVFGLGVLGYQLLTGEQPYRGAHIAAVMDAVRAGRRRPLAEAAPDAPADLCALIEGALAHDPTGRPSDLEAFARSLHDAVRPEPIEAVGSPDVTGVTVFSDRRPAAIPPSETAKASKASNGRRRVLTGAAVLVAVVALVSSALIFGRGETAASDTDVAVGSGPFQRDLAIRQSADGVVVAERWTLEDGTLDAQVVAKNTSGVEVPYQLDVIVPKAVAESVDDIRWGSDYTSVVQPDPIVRYCLTLAPGQQKQLTWSVDDLEDAQESDLDAWAAAWEEDLRSHVADPGGEPCPGTTPPDTTISDAPNGAEGTELAGGIDFGATPGFAGGSGSGGSSSGGLAGGGGDTGGATPSGGGSGSGTTESGDGSTAGGSTSGGTTGGGSGGGVTIDDPPTTTSTTTTTVNKPAVTTSTTTTTRPPATTEPAPDSCPGGDFSPNRYDGSCGNAPPVANDDTGPSIGFGSNESGTKCPSSWAPLVINPINNDSDREGSGLAPVWVKAYDSNGSGLARGGSVIKTEAGFNAAGNPTICLTRSYASSINSIKIEYQVRDTGGKLSNVAVITIPVFVR